MKNLISFLLGLLTVVQLQAQIPEMFTYQAIARHGNAPGDVLMNQSLTVRLSLKENSASGDIIWEEDHSVQTNDYGLFTCRMGNPEATRIQGSALVFAEIPWENGNMYLETSIYYENTWLVLGGAPLLSVPYALYAKNVLENEDADADPQNEKISQAALSGTNLEITEGGHTWIIDVSSLVNTDNQGISIDGNTISLENGGSIDLTSFLDNPFTVSGDTLSRVNGSLSLGSNSAGGSKLSVTGNDVLDDEALFEVKRKDGHTVFAVYNTGVRINLPEDTLMMPTKGRKGGFAIGGFSDAKDYTREYMRITPDSVRFWLKQNPLQKGRKGGFAIGGFSDAKNPSYEYLRITHDSTRIYINDDATATKGRKGGFAIGGFSDAKNPARAFLRVTDDSTRVNIKEGDSKGRKGGFAIGGFSDAKGEEFEYFNVSGLNSVDTVADASQLLWYPQKEALLAGRVHIGSPDSVGTNSTALGFQSVAMGNWSQAFGYQSIAIGDYSSAIGKYARTENQNAFAFGDSVVASGENAYAFGSKVTASGKGSLAMGLRLNDTITGAIGDYTIALGLGAQALGQNSVSLGVLNTADALGAVAAGYRSSATGSLSVAIGYNSKATASGAVAMGYNGEASGQESLAINGTAQGRFSIAIGELTDAKKENSICIGFVSVAKDTAATAIGNNANAWGKGSFATNYSVAEGQHSAAIGYQTWAASYASIALGINNVIQGSPDSWSSLDPLLVVGNGTSELARSNALELNKGGSLTIAGNYYNKSDKRLKTNIENLDASLEKIMQLNPVSFCFKDQETHPEGTQIGLIAQEVIPVFPDLVYQDFQGYYSVNYTRLSIVLLKAFQEQQWEIQKQESENAGYKARLERMEEENQSLMERLEQLENQLSSLLENRK